MTDDVPKKSRGEREKSMLDILLERWEMDYQGFSRALGIDYDTLLQYRKGKRRFRLDMEQIQKLEALLEQVDRKFRDLPTDWIRDKQAREEK
jgi:hypothetical protein